MENYPVITRVERVQSVFFEKGRDFAMKNRPSFGLSFCYEGQITYTMKSKSFVSRPGTAILLPKGGDYTIHGDRDGIFPLINFQAPDFSLLEIRVIDLASPAPCLRCFEHLFECFHPGEREMKVFSLLYEILDLVFSSRDETALTPVLRFAEENLSDPGLSNPLLARVAGVSQVTLRKYFHTLLGTTPKQYLLDLRLRKAKLLLTDTALSVGEISESCGFSGPYHFCRIFKEKTGYTPTEFARLHRARQI